ncbi:MAG: zinc ribbon domain-containing protein [Terriglobales bacterium]
MFCNQCGARLAPNVAYCTHCGKAAGIAATAPVAAANPAMGRVTKHRNILGVLWVVAGVLGLPGGLFMIGFSSFNSWSWGWGGPWSGMPHFLGPLVGAFGTALLAYSVLTIIAGVGLLAAQSWARMLAIVLGIIRLINIPFGTALGIYTLWVLLPDQSNVEYGQLADQRARA